MRNVCVGGHRFAVDDDKPSFWDRAEAGTWEPELLAGLRAALHPGAVFLDIGGWVGPTSLYGAACGAEVIALEPDPAAARQFRANLAANPAFSGKIRLIEAALTDSGGSARLASPRKQGDSMSSLLLAGRGGKDWQAAAITPAQLAAEVPRGRPLVVKIDIEGGEYALGAALASIGALQPEVLLIGFHPALILSGDEDGPQRLENATKAIFEAFSGLKAAILGGAAGDPLREALRSPITVRFSRA